MVCNLDELCLHSIKNTVTLTQEKINHNDTLFEYDVHACITCTLDVPLKTGINFFAFSCSETKIAEHARPWEKIIQRQCKLKTKYQKKISISCKILQSRIHPQMNRRDVLMLHWFIVCTPNLSSFLGRKFVSYTQMNTVIKFVSINMSVSN